MGWLPSAGVPVEFLTDEQAETYGKSAEEPPRPELERFFFLDDVDRDLIALRRTKHHQLGFALQICTVRYIGLFLEDPLAVPWPVVEHLAAQLGIEDPSLVERCPERRQTLYDHAREIRDAYNQAVGWLRTQSGAAAGCLGAGPAGLRGARHRGEAAARRRRPCRRTRGPGAAGAAGGHARGAGGQAVLGAGAAAPAADADDAHDPSPARWSGWTRLARSAWAG
ncbi:DUF4158 domain-containing protein [Streptomyces iakyrus]|uniref:DUF4158 domain-containing protein n=1 Tax=Streptomyces iakyrus TaxID=68219 RepID=UPI003F4C9DA1